MGQSEILGRNSLFVWTTLLCYRLRHECYQFVHTPYMIRESGFHRWRDAKRLVDAAEVVISEVQRNRMTVILHLF